MNILVANDDGIQSKGLHVLVEALARVPGNKVYVVAPDSQRSACGHGISMNKIVMVNDETVPGAVWAQSISGTPADCVKYGIRHLKDEHGVKIDLVFSGINHGGNIGTDVFYSGTVSAAIEGVFCGVPAVAISVGTHHPTDEMLYNTQKIIVEICEKVVPKLDKKTVVNVNFPKCAPEEIKGLRAARLGPREYEESFDVLKNPKGRKYYWYTGTPKIYDNLPEGLDTEEFQNGYITVTPLRIDITDEELLGSVYDWGLEY